MNARRIFLRAALATVLAMPFACGPKRPDTSIPTIAITFTSVIANGNSFDIEEDATVDDADGPNDIMSVTCATSDGTHAGSVTNNMNGIWSCDITLPHGNWNVVMTATDFAGWSAIDADQESL